MKISTELPEPLPPPAEGDILFRFDNRDPFANACLNMSSRPDLFYSIGYLEAARHLVKHVLTTHSDQDTLIFPIVFLFRHHIELLLKRLVILNCAVIKRQLNGEERSHLKNHRLDLLWKDIKLTLPHSRKAANLPKITSAELAGVNSYIRQINELDPDSQSFRYAVSANGDSTLAGVTRINILSLSNYIERLCEFVGAIVGEFEMYLDYQAEMAAEEMW